MRKKMAGAIEIERPSKKIGPNNCKADELSHIEEEHRPSYPYLALIEC
jgi:hypothetical protein